MTIETDVILGSLVKTLKPKIIPLKSMTGKLFLTNPTKRMKEPKTQNNMERLS